MKMVAMVVCVGVLLFPALSADARESRLVPLAGQEVFFAGTGVPVEIDELIRDFVEEHGLKIVADAAVPLRLEVRFGVGVIPQDQAPDGARYGTWFKLTLTRMTISGRRDFLGQGGWAIFHLPEETPSQDLILSRVESVLRQF